ncbi:MAG: hypothetical protein U1F61_22030 [Opitutaceae bacterium]
MTSIPSIDWRNQVRQRWAATLRAASLTLYLLVAAFAGGGGLSNSAAAAGATLFWASEVTGQTLALVSHQPAQAGAPGARTPVVFYLLNLPAPRIGTESDDVLIADLLAQGLRVVTVDYRSHPRARVPQLNRDLHQLRTAVQQGLLGGDSVDLARVYLVPSGHRLERDLPYAQEAGRTLCFDLIAPSRPARTVGVVLEFSCDNANRMGNASLQFCSDTVLDAAATEGHAVAMADHPVPAPYKGIDPMPACALRAKAAVRAVRQASLARGLNGRIVPFGFSRGSGIALLLVTTRNQSEFEGYGASADVSSDVQGAVILSGRFTYLDLLPSDPMIPRYEKAWGPRASQETVWRRHGALDYAAAALDVPLFLSINEAESPEALHQMQVLRDTLAARKSPFVYAPESDGRGHRVPLSPSVLAGLHAYLSDRLTPASPTP